MYLKFLFEPNGRRLLSPKPTGGTNDFSFPIHLWDPRMLAFNNKRNSNA